jgi:hypothetical protein
MQDNIIELQLYVDQHGGNLPEIQNWKCGRAQCMYLSRNSRTPGHSKDSRNTLYATSCHPAQGSLRD